VRSTRVWSGRGKTSRDNQISSFLFLTHRIRDTRLSATSVHGVGREKVTAETVQDQDLAISRLKSLQAASLGGPVVVDCWLASSPVGQ
jgi:hypothetical protein